MILTDAVDIAHAFVNIVEAGLWLFMFYTFFEAYGGTKSARLKFIALAFGALAVAASMHAVDFLSNPIPLNQAEVFRHAMGFMALVLLVYAVAKAKT